MATALIPKGSFVFVYVNTKTDALSGHMAELDAEILWPCTLCVCVRWCYYTVCSVRVSFNMSGICIPSQRVRKIFCYWCADLQQAHRHAHTHTVLLTNTFLLHTPALYINVLLTLKCKWHRIETDDVILFLYLHSKDILSVVSLEQSPLRRLTLQQVRAHGHLSTRYISSKTFTHTPEWQVTTLSTHTHSYQIQGRVTLFIINRHINVFYLTI